MLIIYRYYRPSKTDSIPICGDGYKPRSLKFRLRANAEMSYSVRIGPGGGCERYRQW
jgi:hypothetical protein